MSNTSALMNNLSSAVRRSLCVFMFVSAVLISTAAAQERMTAEQIIAKHLASIGSDEARRSTKSHLVTGSCRAVFRGRGEGLLEGRAVVASENTRSLLGIEFASPDYPHEKVGFDGERFRVGYTRPGVRSSLGSFLLIHDSVFKEGLFSGTLSSAWPLLDLSTRGAKVEYVGTDEINNSPVYKLRYSARRGSDLQITLYFDAANFRHVRTQYERVVNSRMGSTPEASARQRETRYRMVEDFSGFKKEGKLTLPHQYQLELTIEATNGTVAYRYEFDFNQFSFNQEIPTEFFNAEAS